jgi:hypothetical protein
MNWNPISVGFILLGVMGLGYGMYNLVRALQAKRWASATGVITSAGLDISLGRHGDRHIQPRIHYRYEIGGRQYTNSKISYGRGFNFSDAQRYVKKYPKGQHVTVYYNPRNRKYSCLERAIEPLGVSFGVLVPAIFLGVGFVFLIKDL